MFGTAERTHTPVLSCCKVASTRLAAVSATRSPRPRRPRRQR
jgi:hypothetical protein